MNQITRGKSRPWNACIITRRSSTQNNNTFLIQVHAELIISHSWEVLPSSWFFQYFNSQGGKSLHGNAELAPSPVKLSLVIFLKQSINSYHPLLYVKLKLESISVCLQPLRFLHYFLLFVSFSIYCFLFHHSFHPFIALLVPADPSGAHYWVRATTHFSSWV